jgi:hypothetical protein
VHGENDKTGSDNDDDSVDWRRAILEHLQNPSATRDWKVQRQVLKYIIMDGDLY